MGSRSSSSVGKRGGEHANGITWETAQQGLRCPHWTSGHVHSTRSGKFSRSKPVNFDSGRYIDEFVDR